MDQETRVFRHRGSNALPIPANVRVRSAKVRVVQTPTWLRVIDPVLAAKVGRASSGIFDKLRESRPRGARTRS